MTKIKLLSTKEPNTAIYMKENLFHHLGFHYELSELAGGLV